MFLIKCFLVVKTNYNKRVNKNLEIAVITSLYNVFLQERKALNSKFLWTEVETNSTKKSKTC